MKKLFFMLLFIQILLPQHPSIKLIKSSNEYYHGTGISQNIDEARDRALSQLTKQIAVRVSSSFEEKLKESDSQITESTKKILKTHSNATLHNVNIIKKHTSAGKIEVFCYLKKNEVDKIFNERKELISEIVKKAKTYESEYNYAYALKNYYFANILLNSLPYQNVNYRGINYTTLIPEKINNIILNTDFKYLKERYISSNEREIIIQVESDGHPISLLDFTFWNGSDQISVQAKDGVACIRLIGSNINFNRLQINIKYSYYNCRKEYKIVEDLWDIIDKPEYNPEKIVELKKKKLIGLIKSKNVVSNTNTFNIKLKTEYDNVPAERICAKTKRFLNLLDKQNIRKIKEFCHGDIFLKDKIMNYIEYNNPKPQEKNIGGYINRTTKGWEVRKIRMLHQYPSINKQSTEYLVLDFSKEGYLKDINVAITKELYDKFVKQGDFADDWNNRQQIIKFMEKYRTAYLCRDTSIVKKMFAEDALIIIGRKIKRRQINPEDIYNKTGNKPEYEYLKLTKERYIKRQQWIFDIQKDIFLDFPSFEINRKNNDPNIYGIEMRQNYFSTTYSDEGYLFLLIDFAPTNPLIYVRAWQPNEWSEDELVRTADFIVHR